MKDRILALPQKCAEYILYDNILHNTNLRTKQTNLYSSKQIP